jgi:ferredoxin
MRIEVDRSQCQLHGQCSFSAPEVFQLVADEDDVRYDPAPPESKRAAVEEAIDVCPEQAIRLIED